MNQDEPVPRTPRVPKRQLPPPPVIPAAAKPPVPGVAPGLGPGTYRQFMQKPAAPVQEGGGRGLTRVQFQAMATKQRADAIARKAAGAVPPAAVPGAAPVSGAPVPGAPPVPPAPAAPPAPAPPPVPTPRTGAVLTPGSFPPPPAIPAASAPPAAAALASGVAVPGGNPAWKRNQPGATAAVPVRPVPGAARGVQAAAAGKQGKNAKAAPKAALGAESAQTFASQTTALGGPNATVNSTNTAGMDPFLKQQVDRYNSRFTNDPTKQAVEHSTLGIMDAAALGAADLKGQMGSRGVLNSGAGATFLQKRVFDPAQRAAAGAASNIAIERQKQLDALTLGGTDIMKAPSQLGVQNRELAMRQWEGQQAAARANEALKLEQQRLADEQAARWLALTQAGYPTAETGGSGGFVNGATAGPLG